MTVHEPATLLTDCLLAGLAGGLAWRLSRRTSTANLAARWWSRALGLSALSALVGGGYHGFAPGFPNRVAEAWWIATLLLIGLLNAAMAMSLMHELLPRGRQRPWTGVIVFQLAAFGIAATARPEFVVAVLNYGLTLLAWAAAALILRRAWRGRMLAAIALSAVAALVQQMRWAPGPRFNHNDLYHVIQACALVGFYQAGRRFGCLPPATRGDP